MAVSRTPSSPVVPAFSPKLLTRLKAPGGPDTGTLELVQGALRCVETGERYPFVDGVPSLMRSRPLEGDDVSRRIRSFYEDNPFPNYEGLEDFAELVNKGSRNSFTRRLLRAIGFNKVILECGCGTGQLTHFLQLNNNHVLGIDLSLSSLALALEHKERNHLARSAFCQMNIFDLAVKDAAFDVVISTGVLHHTFDARRALGAVVRKVKPGGIVLVGLYNAYARIPTWVRSKLVSRLGGRIDYVVRSRIRDQRKAEIWIKDQYYNPHETWHTVDEVLAWFRELDVDYLNCMPPILGTTGEDAPELFAPTETGNVAQRVTTQLVWIRSISREGGLFTVIGRRCA